MPAPIYIYIYRGNMRKRYIMAVLRDDWDWARHLGSLRWDVTDKDGDLIPLAVDVRAVRDRVMPSAVERIVLMVHSAYVKPFDVKVPVPCPQDAAGLNGVLHTLLERVIDGCVASGYADPKGAAVSTGDGLVDLAVID